MCIFDIFKGLGDNETKIPHASIHIQSIEAVDTVEVVVLAITRGSEVLYTNTYEPRIFEGQNQKADDFRGPVYKINLRLTDGSSYCIFYGIVTDDRRGMVMTMGPQAMDTFCIYILKELYQKIPNIFDAQKVENAPTQYTYYFAKCPHGCYITNNSGNDSYFLSNKQVIKGHRNEILKYVFFKEGSF